MSSRVAGTSSPDWARAGRVRAKHTRASRRRRFMGSLLRRSQHSRVKARFASDFRVGGKGVPRALRRRAEALREAKINRTGVAGRTGRGRAALGVSGRGQAPRANCFLHYLVATWVTAEKM